jgi:hypothetical protein
MLDLRVPDDKNVVTAHCQDPLFESVLATPWPYETRDAKGCLGEIVPRGWENDSEYAWALRRDGLLMGVISYRSAGGDLGF